ncbi:MAG: hypothetical protein DHS20C16_15770 [Phycisphaerae bacterium]|nr:MAG: hypothetical protein DHS20C16_15770 [Phycisphaerae bacterium]
MNRYLRIGFVLGLVFGAVVSLPVLNLMPGTVFSLPGLVFGSLCGYFEAFYNGMQIPVAAKFLFFLGNLLFYSVVGLGLGGLASRFGSTYTRPNAEIPECCICGYKWATPTHVDCPKCGHSSFASAILNSGIVPPLCEKCGYDLTGNESTVCPECGEAL